MPGNRWCLTEGAEHLAAGVHEQASGAGLTSQPLLGRLLDPALADEVARLVPLTVACGQLRRVDRRDVAGELGRGRAVRIRAIGQRLGIHPRKVARVLLDVDGHIVGDVRLHRHRLELAVPHVVEPLLDLGLGHPEQDRKAGHHLGVRLGRVAAEGDRLGHRVVHQHPPVAIDDPPPRRGVVHAAHSVAHGGALEPW